MTEQTDYWLKQDKAPLFSNLLWSRPEQVSQAGKLVIIGGNAMGFASVALAYETATKASIGRCRVLLPDSLQKAVGQALTEGEYAPSNPSGGFSRRALSDLVAASTWADGILLIGDFGRNAETAVLLERFLQSPLQGCVTLTKDGLDYFVQSPRSILDKPNITLVANFGQLQKLATKVAFPIVFMQSLDMLHVVMALHQFTLTYPAAVITIYASHVIVSYQGKVSSTPTNDTSSLWQTRTATYAAVWRLQNELKPFEALTTAVFDSLQKPE
jgi:NAD(P)H-hydrate repair Nnr-like enzyme with NAD(P)H-hydrate dehydratase domain